MIKLTRLNNIEFFVNPDLIISLEATPDCIVTMSNGEKFMVREKAPEVVNRFLAYKRYIHQPPEIKASS
jgi:flagellar protein FlbD